MHPICRAGVSRKHGRHFSDADADSDETDLMPILDDEIVVILDITYAKKLDYYPLIRQLERPSNGRRFSEWLGVERVDSRSRLPHRR